MLLVMGPLLAVGVLVGLGLYRLISGTFIPWPLDLRRLFLAGLGAAVIVGVGIQAVPYGRAHSNPPVMAGPEWDLARTEELARRACFDCHSNETVWPWYSNVAPMSWLLTRHVVEGRGELNFSEWGAGEADEADEAAEEVREGSMPTWDYLLAHPEARLSNSEKRELVDGLVATFGDKEEDDERDEDEEDDD